MWTYARAYKPLLPSSERIAYHAETELYQSLNKNRLIAFIGSGVALPYGRLTWAELCALLIMDVDSEFWKKLESYRQKHGKRSFSDITGLRMKEAKFLHCALRSVLGEKKLKEKEIEAFYKEITLDDNDYLPQHDSYLLAPTIDNPISTATTVLELCSKLVSILSNFDENEKSSGGSTNFIKSKAAKYLTENTSEQFASRLKLLNGYGIDSVYQIWLNTIENINVDFIKYTTFEYLLTNKRNKQQKTFFDEKLENINISLK